jgi:glucose-6-phosphate 1-dehydrogenase
MQSDGIDLILFGAAGDLSRRKLLPALMHLDNNGLLPQDLRILALSREQMTTEQFMAGQQPTLHSYIGAQALVPRRSGSAFASACIMSLCSSHK